MHAAPLKQAGKAAVACRALAEERNRLLQSARDLHAAMLLAPVAPSVEVPVRGVEAKRKEGR